MGGENFKVFVPGALLQPEVWPHPVTGVRLIETHISWLFLTGEFAYKVKKPLDLGFLDFSSLEKRYGACTEELRLNRRLAPEIYLEVVPLCGTPQQPVVGGSGTPFEYAVKMRQFDPEQQLDQLAGRGELTPPLLEELAALVARFHLGLAPAPEETPYGTPERVIAPARANLEMLRELLPAAWSERLETLRNWTEQGFGERKGRIRRRRKEGFIRECHGDLHLGNIVRYRGRPLPFDCIEFNPELRWIDVINDIAFTTMDLRHRELPALAARFLNRYLEETGDYPGLPLLRFYETYRALVRAKVAAIRAGQEGEAARESIEEYTSYLDFALGQTVSRQGALLLMHGPSGSGKSVLALRLVEEFGAIRIRSDVERKRLFGLARLERSEAPLAGGIYGREATLRTYRRLLDLATEVVAAGHVAVVDATFLEREQRRPFEALARERNIPLLILSLQAPAALLRQRVRARSRQGTDPSEAGLEVLEHQLASLSSLSGEERDRVLEIDAGREFGPELMEQIRQRLSAARRAAQAGSSSRGRSGCGR